MILWFSKACGGQGQWGVYDFPEGRDGDELGEHGIVMFIVYMPDEKCTSIELVLYLRLA